MNQNGDDAIELYNGTALIETYGDSDIDGTGQEWDYTDSWAYKLADVWIYGGVGCAVNSTSTQNSNCIYPICSSPIFFKGAMEIDTDGGLRIRAYHFEALSDISDISAFKVDIYNNGNTEIFSTVQLPEVSASEGEDILVVRDVDAANVSPYFTSCADNFSIYESTELTSNGDDALVFLENDMPVDTLGVVGVDGTGEPWEYTDAFGYRSIPGAEFVFSGAGCTNAASTNDNASCFYPFCDALDEEIESIERSVLFLGNSYTSSSSFFDIPGIVQQLAASAGDILIQDENTNGGYELKDHIGDDVSISKLKQGGWDYVVLQEQSSLPVRDVESFYTNAAGLDSIRKFSNPVGDVMFYMTWGRRDGFQGLTFEEMNDQLRERYRIAQSNQNGLVSPVGAVWRFVRENDPDLGLYDPDGSHPSNIGAYLSACTFYTSIFEKDPTELSFDFDLSASDAQTIREAVKAVVFDSLDFWNVYKPLREENISIDFDSLQNNQTFTDTTLLDLTVTATSTSTSIDAVTFLINGDTTAVDNAAPYDPQFSLESIGEYTITAVATDANGGQNYAVRNIRRSQPSNANALQLQGIISFQTGLDSSNRERAIHLFANEDISDLSVFGIGIANNGGGSDGREMNLPAISVSAGDDILFIRDEDVTTIEEYFGACFAEFEHTAEDPGINFNGDDGLELYLNDDVIEIYGDVIEDGTGLPWEYTGSWAFKVDNEWTYGGVNCTGGSLNTQGSACPYPLCSTENLATDATLADLQVDNTTIDGFASEIFSYTIELPAGTITIPEVTATSTDVNASIVITAADELPGTTTVLVVAEDGVTQQTYSVEFTLAPSGEASLADLQVDGVTVEGFSSGTFDYVINLPLNATVVPTVTATATDDNATIEIVDAASLPGTTSVLVTAEDGTTQLTYTVEFILSASDDATLSDLKVDGETIDGFVSALLNYAVELPADRTSVPDVTATTTDGGASVDIEDANALPGITNVTVTAEDGATQLTYTIAFTLEGGSVTGIGDENLKDFQLVIENGRLYARGESLRKVQQVMIYSLAGKLVYSQQLNNSISAELIVPQKSVSIIRMLDKSGKVIYNKKVIKSK